MFADNRTRSARLRWAALCCAVALTAGCGGGDSDAGGESGGGEAAGSTSASTASRPAEPSGSIAWPDFDMLAFQACAMTRPIADAPEQYEAAADALAEIPLPMEDTEKAVALVAAMQGLVAAHADLIDAVLVSVPGVTFPPASWMLVESGRVYVSRTGEFADLEETDVPTSVGTAFTDAQEALSAAAADARIDRCAPVSADVG